MDQSFENKDDVQDYYTIMTRKFWWTKITKYINISTITNQEEGNTKIGERYVWLGTDEKKNQNSRFFSLTGSTSILCWILIRQQLVRFYTRCCSSDLGLFWVGHYESGKEKETNLVPFFMLLFNHHILLSSPNSRSLIFIEFWFHSLPFSLSLPVLAMNLNMWIRYILYITPSSRITKTLHLNKNRSTYSPNYTINIPFLPQLTLLPTKWTHWCLLGRCSIAYHIYSW